MTDLSKKRVFNANIKNYLNELQVITGKPVAKSELGDPDEALAFRDMLALRSKNLVLKFTLGFDQLSTERFKSYLINLEAEKRDGIYIWTNRSVICGLYMVDRLSDINFSFSFGFTEGVIGFSTKDSHESLLLDFYEGSSSAQLVDVEARGDFWSKVTY